MSRKKYDAVEMAHIRKIKSDFRQGLDVYLREKPGRSLANLAKKIGLGEKQQGRISKWRSDKYETEYPDHDYQEEIRKEFKDPSLFRYTSDDDYTFNTESMNQYIDSKYYKYLHPFSWGVSDEHDRRYNNMQKSFHLFLQFLKSLEGYDSNFPLWTPIISADGTYKRADYKALRNAAPSDLKEFQVDKGDEGIKTLSMEDTRYILELYWKTKDYIFSDFSRQKKRLDFDADRIELINMMRHFRGEDSDITLGEDEMYLLDSYYCEASYFESEHEKIQLIKEESETKEGSEK